MRARPASPIALLLLLAACTSGDGGGGEARSAASVRAQPVVCGEGSCAEVGQTGTCQFVADLYAIPGTFLEVVASELPAGVSTFTAGADTFSVTLPADAATLDWTATTGVDFVVAGGPRGANAYFYAAEATGDTALSAFLGDPIGSVAFCYDVDAPPPPASLVVEKTASTSSRRTWRWAIAKTSPTSALTLAPGQTQPVSYSVTATATPFDSDWLVTGQIVIRNPAAAAAVGVTLEDSYGGLTVVPDCGAFDGTIAAGATVTCTYAVSPGAALDATNVVTVTTAEGPAGATASAAVTFGPATSVVDACVTVDDDRFGALGAPCAAASPWTRTYELPIGPYAVCDASGEGTAVLNTASFSAPSGATGSSTWSVIVDVPCVSGGCTRTQGYWKTHGRSGPAPFDETWLLVGPAADDTLFAISGQSWHEVLATAPRGNAWYILAHQYLAARLNVLAGADASAISAELAWAEAFFAAHPPGWGFRPPVAQVMIATAGTLARYNEGVIGPGHCESSSR